jgi:hypothetical protein
MRKFKVFTVVTVMAVFTSGMFNACKKDDVAKTKGSVI